MGSAVPDQIGTHTVVMILSANVCRLASHSGNRNPTKQMIASIKWASWRTTDIPKPIGCPVVSLTTLNFSTDLPMLDPMVPWR